MNEQQFEKARDTAALVGRMLIAWLFIPAGWAKLLGFSGTAAYIATKGVPLPEVCAAIAIVMELGLGVLLAIGWQARWAALGLAIFVAVITPIFHNYWAVPDAQATVQRLFFFKNCAVLGGLLLIVTNGAGKYGLQRA